MLIQLIIFSLISGMISCKNYTLDISCDTCKYTKGCAYNTCFFMNGGPVRNLEMECAGAQLSLCKLVTLKIYAQGVPCSSCCFSVNPDGSGAGCFADRSMCLSNDDDSSDGLGAGAIIGIIIGVLGVAAITGGLIWYFKFRKPRQPQNDLNPYQRA